jgi:hypothetical protein
LIRQALLDGLPRELVLGLLFIRKPGQDVRLLVVDAN